MTLARYQDLCLDAVDAERSQAFWAAALGLESRVKGRNLLLSGPSDRHRLWINEVAEPKAVKNRAHLDVHCSSVAALLELGATLVQEFPRWTVLADPDGQEFCAFVREEVPDYRLYELVIDAVAPAVIGHWWAEVLGARLDSDAAGDFWLSDTPGLPFEAIVFQPVPEPKKVKNRVHFDVTVDSVPALVDAGATLLREPGGDIDWSVLADPEGNEFCAFR
jgi:catechol 2,3-dioxygenase-like lactoylglutathione lyase family enzyme